MDDRQFDDLVRALSGSRRALLGVGAALGVAPLVADAKKKKKKVKVCVRGQTLTVPKKQQNQFILGGATLGACPVTPPPPPPTCTDGLRNGNETGVDCGGSCPKCADGQPCLRGSDCIIGSCVVDASSPTGRTCGECPGLGASCGANCSCEAIEPDGVVTCISVDESQMTDCDAACTGDRVCMENFPLCTSRCTT